MHSTCTWKFLIKLKTLNYYTINYIRYYHNGTKICNYIKILFAKKVYTITKTFEHFLRYVSIIMKYLNRYLNMD